MKLAVALVLAALFVVLAPPLTAGAAELAPLPPRWPSRFELGMADGLGDAAGIRATAPFGLRSQYLAGGANTGTGWSTWEPDGGFVARYANESFDAGMIPVFDYYMLLQSTPSTGANESDRDYANLTNAATMSAYFEDLKLFFQRAGTLRGRTIVLHFEPDLFGFIQQRALLGNPEFVPIAVGSTGMVDLSGLPDNAAGLAQAVIRLRDRYAPNVLVGYHMSVWGTGQDILYTKPADAVVEILARSSAEFYLALHADFDLIFAEASDRDAGFRQLRNGDNGAWWSDGDYARNVLFLGTFSRAVGRRVVLWQLPLGNTRMRAQNQTWGHYQDNHVEWLLDDGDREHLSAYASAGVVAAIFGGGGAGATCACDATNDGVTNPSPINGNVLPSLSADDDGGFFRAKAATYYALGPLQLPVGAPAGSSDQPEALPLRGHSYRLFHMW